jgi:hypothetical protein
MEKALILSWNSVAVQHTTVDNRNAFGTLPYSKIIPHLTMHQFYEVFVWSMNALATGVFPDRDHTGKKFTEDFHPERARLAGQWLAGGFVGAWSEFRGEHY